MKFINNYSDKFLYTLLHKNIVQGIPIGLTVDHKRCSWAKSFIKQKFAYHFILVIGYTQDEFICIDNATIKPVLIRKDIIFEISKEILVFKKTEILENFQISSYFLSEKYMKYRFYMSSEIKSLKKDLLSNIYLLDSDEVFMLATKFSLIASNFECFKEFVCKNKQCQYVSDRIERIIKSYNYISFLIVKITMKKKDYLIRKIEDQFEAIGEYQAEIYNALSARKENK